MKGAFSGAPTRGVSTLMYVGDDGTSTPTPTVSNRELVVGAAGALAAIFSRSIILRTVGAGAAVYVGVMARRAKLL